jgi:hypothetical protein
MADGKLVNNVSIRLHFSGPIMVQLRPILRSRSILKRLSDFRSLPFAPPDFNTLPLRLELSRQRSRPGWQLFASCRELRFPRVFAEVVAKQVYKTAQFALNKIIGCRHPFYSARSRTSTYLGNPRRSYKFDSVPGHQIFVFATLTLSDAWNLVSTSSMSSDSQERSLQ